MTKDQKNNEIVELTEKFKNNNYFYIANSESLTVEQVTNLRKLCFSKGVEMRVAKNTLIRKALEASGQGSEELYGALKGQSSIFFSEVGNSAAKVILSFRDKGTVPSLKVAYIDSGHFFGDDQLPVLSKLKSKNELIGEIISLLQSPAKNVISGLKASSSGKIAGLVKKLQEKAK